MYILFYRFVDLRFYILNKKQFIVQIQICKYIDLVSCIHNYTYNKITYFTMITNNLRVFYQAFYGE